VREPLPVDAVLPDVADALRRSGGVVLRAPTGAGKTTRVPPAILDAGLAGEGQIVVLEPRRVAVRAAARRMAEERGGRVGDEIGYQVRFDRRAGSATRVLVVTEALLLRMLQADPFLAHVGAVVFDEFHERSLVADLALAMVQRLRDDARPDLRIVVMSATLDTSLLSGYLAAPVVESEGFLYPVTVRHLDRPDERRVHEVVAAGVKRALAETAGDVLAFMPGVGEIRSTGGLLADVAAHAGLVVHELYGDLPPKRQDAALRAGDTRRVILATNVAETSVTVEGITAVVDSGWARVMRHDPAVGLDRLVHTRIARSSIEQRTGRAGRTAPGVCYRLWTAAEEKAFPVRLAPEVRRVDLAGAALELLAWGETNLPAFPWIEAPEPARLAVALDLLRRLGATEDGRITEIGRNMVRLPVHPRIARVLVEAHRLGIGLERCAFAAAVLSERDPIVRSGRPRPASHTSDSDILDRMSLITARHVDGRVRDGNAGRLDLNAARWIERVAKELAETASRVLGPSTTKPPPNWRVGESSQDRWTLRQIFAGYPDRLARRRAPGDRRAVMVTGKGVKLAVESAVTDAELFVCIDVNAGTGPEALVRRASAVRREWLPPERILESVDVSFDEQAARVVAVRRVRFDELILEEHPADAPRDERSAALLAEAASQDLSRALDLDSPALASLRARVAFLREHVPELGLPVLDDDSIRAVLSDLCAGKRSFAELRQLGVVEMLRWRLSREQGVAVDRDAPERIPVPSGSRIALRYEPGRPPILPVRIQEVFGLRETPRVARGRVKVLLHLLAPNQRAQQITDDLASFWANTYPVVRAELRRRYPRHAWPEDPLSATPERLSVPWSYR